MFGIVGDKECITGKVCEWYYSGTNAAISMEIYDQNNQRICTTNSLDYPFYNDFKRNATFKYCGDRYLVQCFGKAIPSNFHVVLIMDHPFYDSLLGYKSADPVCLDYLAHETVFVDKNSGQKVPVKHNSKSHGWSVNGDAYFTKMNYGRTGECNAYGYEKNYPLVRCTLPRNPATLFDRGPLFNGTILARYWGT